MTSLNPIPPCCTTLDDRQLAVSVVASALPYIFSAVAALIGIGGLAFAEMSDDLYLAAVGFLFTLFSIVVLVRSSAANERRMLAAARIKR